MSKELAIIEEVGFGMRDVGVPVLWFGVKMLSGGSLQVLSVKEAIQLIKENDIYGIKNMTGKPCVVDVDGQTVKFLRMVI